MTEWSNGQRLVETPTPVPHTGQEEEHREHRVHAPLQSIPAAVPAVFRSLPPYRHGHTSAPFPPYGHTSAPILFHHSQGAHSTEYVTPTSCNQRNTDHASCILSAPSWTGGILPTGKISTSKFPCTVGAILGQNLYADALSTEYNHPTDVKHLRKRTTFRDEVAEVLANLFHYPVADGIMVHMELRASPRGPHVSPPSFSLHPIPRVLARHREDSACFRRRGGG